MPRRRGFREKRRRIFVACEGESEAGYVAFLSHLTEEAQLSLHLDIRPCRGGDHLAVIEAALDDMGRRVNHRGAYALGAIFLDGDRRHDVPERTIRADRLIRENSLLPIWSFPAFEALLLTHFPGCHALQPATPDLALQELKLRWPNYEKGMSAIELRRHLDLAAVLRAAGAHDGLRAFLAALGLYR